LVVWRYGTDVVQMVADVQETAPIEMAQAASMAASATASKVFNMGHRVSKLPIGPVAETAVDVYKKNAGKEERPQDMPVKEIKKAIVVSPDTRDTTGIVGRSMAYLATIFMLTAKKRAVSI
ncbi:MAG TPA: hypothetical protein VN457_04140, partial [Chlamydiales bacterium]|nr:hypothetical protein [Chlamydiales bacterium]